MKNGFSLRARPAVTLLIWVRVNRRRGARDGKPARGESI